MGVGLNYYSDDRLIKIFFFFFDILIINCFYYCGKKFLEFNFFILYVIYALDNII